MALSLPHEQRRLRHQLPPWASLFAWALCGLALIQAWLMVSITNPRASSAIAIQLLQPITALGAVGLMLVAAWRHGPGARRWTWSLHAIAILSSAAGNLLQIRARATGTPIVTPASDTLYMLTYVLALIGTAMYLPLRSWWVGSTLRMLLDSAAVSSATLVLMHSLLPLIIQPWSRQFSAQLSWLALDAGVLFVISILGLRFRGSGGPLVALMFPSVLCLLIADVVFLFVSRLPDGPVWYFVPGPLYTLHRVLLALGAYRGVTQPPRAPTSPFTVMPMTEWLMWTMIPRALALAAIAAALIGVAPPRATLLALLLVSVGREALAVYEQRRVLRALHAAQDHAQHTATQTQEFLARIIHDIAAPLHGLRSAARRLSGTTDGRGRDLLHVQLDQLDYLVTQLRAYQQARHIRATLPTMTAIDPIAVCAATVDAAQDLADARGIQLRLVVLEEVGSIVADAAALRRVLDNLLANAITATASGGEVVLRIGKLSSATVLLEVLDTGCGIPPEQHEAIFAPLVRLRGSGTGLGLPIARELVHAMRGEIGVRSQVGRGSIFWVHLPAASQFDKMTR